MSDIETHEEGAQTQVWPSPHSSPRTDPLLSCPHSTLTLWKAPVWSQEIGKSPPRQSTMHVSHRIMSQWLAASTGRITGPAPTSWRRFSQGTSAQQCPAQGHKSSLRRCWCHLPCPVVAEQGQRARVPASHILGQHTGHSVPRCSSEPKCNQLNFVFLCCVSGMSLSC